MLRTLTTLLAIGWRIVGLQTSDWQPPSQPPRGPAPATKPSGMAIATLVCGIGAWTILPLVAAFAGVVIGWMELGSIKRGQSPVEGKLLTQIGFWMSVASLVFWVLGGCAFAAFYFGLFALLFGVGAAGAVAGP